jgi:hypothetical protein
MLGHPHRAAARTPRFVRFALGLMLGPTLLGSALPVAAQAPPPTVLGSLGNGPAWASTINDAGDVAGGSRLERPRAQSGPAARAVPAYGFYKPFGRPMVRIELNNRLVRPVAINARPVRSATTPPRTRLLSFPATTATPSP